MCIVSNVGDYWEDRYNKEYPWADPLIHPSKYPAKRLNVNSSPPSREEFEALKKEVEELKTLLIAAQKFDQETNQPNCELEEKIALIKKVAEFVGVDFKDVFPEQPEKLIVSATQYPNNYVTSFGSGQNYYKQSYYISNSGSSKL